MRRVLNLLIYVMDMDMTYDAVFAESMISSNYIKGWNLGDVYITDGFGGLAEDIPENNKLLIKILTMQFLGDYGLVSCDANDLNRANQARGEGRPFAGIFNECNEYIKVVTNPSASRTVVCLLSED